MSDYDFFGTPLDHTDRENIDILILNPLEDAARVMHTYTCTSHDHEIDRDAVITLLQNEVRAISFIVPHWCSLLPPGSVERLPEGLFGVMSRVDAAAVNNDQLVISVADAEILYPTLAHLDYAVQVISIADKIRKAIFGDDADS